VKISRSPKAIGIALAVLVVSLAADLASKEWALQKLSQARSAPVPLCVFDEHAYKQDQRFRKDSVELVPGWLEFRYAENCGAAFGLGNTLGHGMRFVLFFGAALLAIGVLGRMFLQGKGGALFALSVPLIASGAIGNIHDRIRHGYVVDFIRAYHGTWEYPTFNIADAAISVGVALLLIEGIFTPAEKKPSAAATGASVPPAAPTDVPSIVEAPASKPSTPTDEA
jgi:signal peptidase II